MKVEYSPNPRVCQVHEFSRDANPSPVFGVNDPDAIIDDVLTVSEVAGKWPRLTPVVIASLPKNGSFGFWRDATPEAVGSNFSISVLHNNEGMATRGVRWGGHVISTMSEATKKSLGISGKWFNHIEYAYSDSGQAKEFRTRFQWFPKNKQIVVKKRVKVGFQGSVDSFVRDTKEITFGFDAQQFQLSCAIAFNAHYLWSMDILAPSGRGVRLINDATAFRDFFSDRSLREGMSRRDALRHWVRKHTRRIKCTAEEDADTFTWIRKHLRGVTDFEWHGYHCRIRVPPAQLKDLG